MRSQTPEQVLQRRRAREVAVLFALFVAPGLASSVPLPQVATSLGPLVSLTLRNVAFALVVLYILDVQGERFHVGARPPQRDASPGTTVLVWAVLLATSLAVGAVASAFIDPGSTPGPGFPAQLDQRYARVVWVPTLIVAMVSVGYVEELFFRAYLIERLGQLGRPRGQAVAIAAVMFSVGHGYQGWAALVFALLAGAALGALWLRRRRLIGFAAGHALYNLTAIGLSTWYG